MEPMISSIVKRQRTPKKLPPHDMEKVLRASYDVLAAKTVQETHKAIVDCAMKLVGAKYGSIFLPQEGEMRRVYASSPHLHLVKPRKHGKTFEVYRSRKGYLLFHTTERKKVHPRMRPMPIGSDISVPLAYEKDSLGVLSVLSDQKRFFTTDDYHLIEQFGSYVSRILQKAVEMDKLRKSLDQRDVFLSIAAHELKNPLTVLSAYAQMLSRLKTAKIESVHKYAQRMEREIARLTRLVDELLGVGRIQTQGLKISREPCNLRQIINRALSDSSFMYPEHTIVFRNKLPDTIGTIFADQDKLLQVLINLISNAAKYSRQGTMITITAVYKKPTVQFSIKDQGKGIPKEELTNIFKRFYRGRNADASSLGLGLYLVKHIIDKHDGTITIRSRIGKGTTVTVSLPEYGTGKQT